jgi:succinate dehydrogenase iron-sulfur subunit
VLRDQDTLDKFVGPRFMIYLADQEMHPPDTADRIPAIRNDFGSGYCNITKCCSSVPRAHPHGTQT